MSTLTCPHCHNVVFEDETVCPHCGAWLDGPHGRGAAGGGSAAASGSAFRAVAADDPDATMVDTGAAQLARTGAATRPAARSSSRGGGSGRQASAARRPIDPSKVPQRAPRARRASDTTAQTTALIVVAMLGAMILVFYGINRFSGGKGTVGGGDPMIDPLDDDGKVETPVALMYQKVLSRREPDGLVLLVETAEGQLGQGECEKIRNHVATVLNEFRSAGTLVDEFNSIDVYREWRAGGGVVKLQIRASGKPQVYFSQEFGLGGGGGSG